MGESDLLLAFLDLAKCCFRKRAKAGKGNGAGRLFFLVFSSDGPLLQQSEPTDFWDTVEATPPLTPELFAKSNVEFGDFSSVFFTAGSVSPFN